MSINAIQLRDFIIGPSLNAIGLYSDAAVNLLLGTAAQESLMGTYIKQIKGPALGIYQMEPASYDYTWLRHVEPSSAMKAKVKLFLGFEGKPPASRMISDLCLATIMTRLFYANILETLPPANDVKALARYWKIYYNTKNGSGTIEEFIKNYQKYVSNEIN